jgi:predicted PhzF superfamily epimerase YddE/YHI9
VRRFRYFVPRRELEMCVHATVAEVAMLMQAGTVPGEVTVEMAKPEIAGSAPTVAEIAAALRIPPSAVGGLTGRQLKLDPGYLLAA